MHLYKRGFEMKHIHRTYSQFSWILCVLLLALPLLSHAEIYKWKDKDGKIRYSDTPPPSNIKQETLRGKKVVKSSAQAPLVSAETAKPPPIKEGKKEAISKEEDAAKKRQTDAEADKKTKQEKEKQEAAKAENCKTAKANLENYTQGGHIYKINEKGEREYVSDAGLAEGKAKAQQDIDENCN
jgi:type IV secretory pathway VirB10-like protein